MATLQLRELNQTDDIRIMKAFETAFYKGQKKKEWMQEFGPDDAPKFMERIIGQDGVFSCIVNDTFLLCYDICSPWYTDKKYLEECMVLRIYRNPVGFECVVEALEELARRNNACGIYVATDMSDNDNKLSLKYQSHGFKEESTKLFKRIKYERTEESS